MIKKVRDFYVGNVVKVGKDRFFSVIESFPTRYSVVVRTLTQKLGRPSWQKCPIKELKGIVDS